MANCEECSSLDTCLQCGDGYILNLNVDSMVDEYIANMT